MSPGRKRKMSTHDEVDDIGSWECTVCTYRNRFEAFKCEMCDTRTYLRKGTSTRKPKLNENVVAMQTVVQNFVVQHSQKIPKRRSANQTHSVDSPTTSRHSPESGSSGSAIRGLNTRGGDVDCKRKHVPIRSDLIDRDDPKKVTVTVDGKSATITEFRSKMVSSVGFPTSATYKVKSNSPNPSAEKTAF